MNEQVIDDLYNRAVSLGYKKDRNSYVKLIHSNPSVFNDSYSYVKSKGYKKSTNDFSVLIGLAPKKKVPTQVSKPLVGSSGTTETPQKQSSDSSKQDGIYKYQGNLKANYKKENGQWYIDPTGGTKFQPLTQGDVAKRVKILESQAKREFNPYLETEEKFEFKAETKQAKPTEKVVGVDKKAQDVFKKEFQALDENDPIVIQRNTQDKKTNELISKATTAMNLGETEAIVELKKIFNQPGYNLFDFEETGAGDAVKVINKKTGESKVFAFDTDDKTEMDKLTAFINMNVKYKAIGDLTEESKKLQEQIDATYDPNKKLELSRKLKEVNNKLKIEESVRLSDATTDKNKAWSIYDKDAQQNAKAKIDSQLIRAIDYREKKKDLDKRQADLDAALKNNKITYEDYKTKYLPSILAEKEQLSVEEKEIKSTNSELAYESDRLNEVAGYNMLAQAERGDFLSGVSASFLKGVESPFRLIAGAAGVKTEKGFMMDELLAGLATDEYISDEKRSDIEKALFSVSESLGAAAGGAALTGGVGGVMSGPGATLGTYALSYYSLKDEIDSDPDMANVSEGEKMFLSGIYGGVIGLLDKFGLSKSLSKNPLGKKVVNGIMSKVLTSLPKDATADMIEAAVNSEVKSVIAKGIVNTAGGFINEGATEGLQEFADVTIRDLYNKAKGKELLDKPKTWGEIFERAGESFWLGGLGGAAMSGATQAVEVPKQLRTVGQLKSIERIIDNPDMMDIFTDDLKVKVLNGEMSASKAKAAVNEMRESQAVFNMIPADVENKYAAFKLISEREFLSKEIEGKDPALVEDKKQRVNQIEEELRTLPKKQENAVQERSTEEVLPREQDQAGEAGGQREGMGQSIEGEEVTQEGVTEEKVKDLIGSRVSLTGFGGVTFEKPLIGEMYVGGQQVIFEESATGKFYELGNVNEISNSNFKDLGIDTKTTEGDIAQSSVVPTENGMLQYNGEEFNVDGKVKMKNNEVDRVILTSPDGARTVTLRGQEAIDAAYLITLNKIQSPEQEAMINDLLEQDEEFKRETENIKFTETENVAEEEAVADTEQADGETTGEVETEEEQRARLESLITNKQTKEPARTLVTEPLDLKVNVSATIDGFDDLYTEDNSIENIDESSFVSLTRTMNTDGNGFNVKNGILRVRIGGRDSSNRSGGGTQVSLRIPDGFDKDTFANELNNISHEKGRITNDTVKKVVEDVKNAVSASTFTDESTVKFQKTEPIAADDIEAIRKEIESIDSEVVNAEIPSDLTTKNKIDVKSLRSRFGDELKASFKGGIIKSISYFNGIPMTFSISDQLGSGIYINPITGNKFLLNGGLGFNLTKGNKFFAWANVEEKEAKDMLKRATDTYENNKDLFEKLWDEGTLPKGLVPVAIAKMGQDSILSNEALFRVAADIFKNKLPLENRVKALNVLSNILNNNIDRIGKISKDKRSDADKTLFGLSKAAYEFIQENNFKSIDELFDNINNLKPIRARGLVSNLSFVGDVQLESTKKPGNPSKDVSKALVEGLDKSYNKFISAQFINDLIKEEATSNIPDQHIIAVVGVDVINPSIGTPNHRNYSAGVKGELIGILENPVHAADAFPGFYARTFTMIKPDKSGKIPSMKQSIGQAVAVGGSIVNMKSLVGARLTSNMTDIQKLLAKLKLAFPSVTIADTVEEFNKALEDPSVKAFTRDGDIIYGFTKGNKVFLNPAIATENTAIHEFAHIWMGFLRQNNPKLLQKGFDLAKKSELYKQKLAENNGDVDLAAEETLAELIASKGEAIFLAAKDASNFKDWLNAMYTYIKTKIPGFKNLTPKQFENLTLEEFVDNSLNSLLSGKEVTQKEVKSIKVLFSKANMTAEEVIRVGRANRISDAVIDRYLQDNGFTGYETLLSTSKPQAKPRTELKDLENKIRLYARAKRETKQEIVSVIKNITDTIKGMVTNGPMKRMQFRYIMTKLSRVNFSKQESIDDFIDYVFKKMTDAEYVQKLTEIGKLNRAIGKNNKMVAEVAKLAKDFTKINPALVSNIDTHLALAKQIKQSLAKYTKNGSEVEFRKNVDVATLSRYIQNNKDNVNKPVEKTLPDIYEKYFGEGSSNNKTNEQMLEGIAQAGTDKVNALRNEAKDEIAALKEIIDNDPNAPDVVKRAANVDMSFITFDNAVDIINGISMYIDNGIVSGLTKLVEKYEGEKAVRESKIRFSKLRGLFGGAVSRSYASKFTYNDMIISKKQNKKGQADQFKKESKSGQVQEGYNRGDIETARKKEAYTNKFNKIKNFFEADNKAERTLFAFVQRNVSNDAKKADEFLRRKRLVLDSITQLRKDRTKKSSLIADLTEKIAKKLGILNPDGTVNESITIDEIRKNTEAYNVSAVKWMQAMHAEKFGEFVDHVLGFHNTLLEQEDFYTPDRLSVIDPNNIKDGEDVSSSDFARFTGMTIEKAGSFMKANRPPKLKNRFINLDFEENNFGSHKAMLHDLYTSAAKEFHNAYRTSESFEDVMGDKGKYGSGDAKLYNQSYLLYIAAKENKTKPDTETERKAKVFLNGLGTITSAAALGSIKNIAAQTVPIYTDAIMSAHGPLGVFDEGNWIEIIYDSFDKRVMKLIEEANSQVATRGADVLRFNEKVEKQILEKSRAAKIAGKAANIPVITSEVIMKVTNQYGDKLSAVGVWMTNYRKYCKDNGIDVDFDNLNKDAAQYAENKTKIQILPSDSAERGQLGASNTVLASMFRQIFFPYSSFSINAKNRIYKDVLNIVNSSWTTKEGFQLKKESTNDLIAAGTGLVMFQAINYSWRILVGKMLISAFLDDEDEEELMKKIKQISLKISVGQGINDVLSPLPILDIAVTYGANQLISMGNLFGATQEGWEEELKKIKEEKRKKENRNLTEEEEVNAKAKYFDENAFQLFTKDEISYWEQFGGLGVLADKALDMYDLTKSAFTGRYTSEYKGNVTEKTLTKKGQEKMQALAYLKSIAILLPSADIINTTDKAYKMVGKKYSMTDTQVKNAEEIEKWANRIGYNFDKYAEQAIKLQESIDDVENSIRKMHSMSNDEKQEYLNSLKD